METLNLCPGWLYHIGCPCSEILNRQMQRNKATRARRVDVLRRPLEVKEPADTVCEHGRGNPHCRVALLGFIVLLQDAEVVVCETPRVDRCVGTRALRDGDSGCNSEDQYNVSVR
jgi:hypothetical protein